MELITEPSIETQRIAEIHNPEDAYKEIALRYGGKAAGLILTHKYLKESPLERCVTPFGVALSEEEILADNAGKAYNILRAQGISNIIARSSATVEDGFDESYAGRGISRKIEMKTKKAFVKDLRKVHNNCKEYLEDLATPINFVLSELMDVDGVHIVHSDSDLHRNKIRICSYLRKFGDLTVLDNNKRSYSNDSNVCDLISLIHRQDGSIVRIPAVPSVITNTELHAFDPKRTSYASAINPSMDALQWVALRAALDTLDTGYISDTTVQKFRGLPFTWGHGDHKFITHTEVEQTREIHKLVHGDQDSQLGRIAMYLEQKCGYPVDLEIGFRGEDLFFFQNRPLIKTVWPPRTVIQPKENILFHAQTVNKQYAFRAPLQTHDVSILGTDQEHERQRENMYRVVTPPHSVFRYSGQTFGGDKFCESAIYFGDVTRRPITGIGGHGQTMTITSDKYKIFCNPLLYPFVSALGTKVEKDPSNYVLPFEVEVISDGAVGYIALPHSEVDAFRSLAAQKLSQLDSKLGLHS